MANLCDNCGKMIKEWNEHIQQDENHENVYLCNKCHLKYDRGEIKLD